MELDKIKNPDAENALLQLCILNKDGDNSTYAEIGSYLTAKDFYSAANQAVYEAVAGVFADGGTLAIPSVMEYIDKHGLADKIGSPFYLTKLCEGMAYLSQLKLYASQIKECSHRRQMIILAHDIESEMQDKTIEVSESLSRYVDSIEGMRTIEQDHSDNSLEEAFNSFISIEDKGISWGIPGIDRVMKKMQEGHYIVLAGRPAMGKTALALNFVRNVCRQGYKVLYFSLEMTKRDLYKRLIACESGITEVEAKTNALNAMAKGETDESRKKYQRLEAGKNRVNGWQLDIVDDVYSLGNIRARTRLINTKKGVDFVVIDHMQLMTIDGFRESRTNEMASISRGIQQLAKDINAPILALSQVNRANENRNDKRPALSDLKESGAIEQDADAIMVIYRDRYYDPESVNDWTEVIVRKHRHGGGGTAKLSYDMARNQFDDYQGIAGQTVKKNTVDGVFT